MTSGAERVVAPGRGVQLGLGLTRLGRPWGVHPAPVPTEAEAADFLSAAIASGIRVFDTAPSYGESEARLGRALARLDDRTRPEVFVATKFGESWRPDTGGEEVTVDHSYDALARSLDTSLERLGTIDLLQLHRSTEPALRSEDVRRAFAHARKVGVAALGASVSQVAHARLAIEELGVTWLQFPFHVGNGYMRDAFAIARAGNCRVLVNRPFGMGRLSDTGSETSPVEAFRFILEEEFSGAILSGTASPAHLRMNLAAFNEAVSAR